MNEVRMKSAPEKVGRSFKFNIMKDFKPNEITIQQIVLPSSEHENLTEGIIFVKVQVIEDEMALFCKILS